MSVLCHSCHFCVIGCGFCVSFVSRVSVLCQCFVICVMESNTFTPIKYYLEREVCLFMESFKIPSQVVNVIVFIAMFILANQEFLINNTPSEYSAVVSSIIVVAGFIATQVTENKRVSVAEELAVDGDGA